MPTVTFPMRGVFRQTSRYQLTDGSWRDYSVQSQETNLLIGIGARTTNSDPNWKAKISKGANMTLPYYVSWYEQKPSVNSCEAYNPVNSIRSFDKTIRTGFEGWNPLTRTDPVLLDQVVASFKRKLSSHHVGSSSLGAPLAEIKEVRGLIGNASTLVSDTLKTLIEIKRTKGRSVVKYASAKWLEMNFGLLPLIDDIDAGVRSLASWLNRSDRPVRITSHALKHYRSSYANRSAGAYGTWLELRESYDCELSYKLIGGYNLRLEATDSDGYNLRSHLGLRLCDLPSVAWELTAYSWVVDYFVTVGPWLDDMFYSPPGELKYLCLNRRFKADCLGQYSYASNGSTILSSSNSPASASLFEFERTSLTTLPHAQLRFRTVDEIGNFGLSKVLNLASVLAGRKL